jgi:translation elongation factor EF-G
VALTIALKDYGFDVRVVMTHGAQAFITPLTFQALSGNPVHTELLDPAIQYVPYPLQPQGLEVQYEQDYQKEPEKLVG